MEESVECGLAPTGVLSFSGRDPDLGHHATVLVLEDMAVKDKIANLRKRYIEHDRCRCALTRTPLIDCASAILRVVNGRKIGNCERDWNVIFHDSTSNRRLRQLGSFR